MTRIYATLIFASLTGCVSPIGSMNLKDGETGCISANSLTLGEASMIVTRADNVGKNQTNIGEQVIKCGRNEMTIKTNTGVAVPPGATTTTTTTITPAK